MQLSYTGVKRDTDGGKLLVVDEFLHGVVDVVVDTSVAVGGSGGGGGKPRCFDEDFCRSRRLLKFLCLRLHYLKCARHFVNIYPNFAED